MNNLLIRDLFEDSEQTDSQEAEEQRREQWEAVVNKESEWDPLTVEQRLREDALARIERDYLGGPAGELEAVKEEQMAYRLDVIEEEESQEISNSDKTDQLRNDSQEAIEKRQLYELVEGESALDEEIDEAHMKQIIEEIDKYIATETRFMEDERKTNDKMYYIKQGRLDFERVEVEYQRMMIVAFFSLEKEEGVGSGEGEGVLHGKREGQDRQERAEDPGAEGGEVQRLEVFAAILEDDEPELRRRDEGQLRPEEGAADDGGEGEDTEGGDPEAKEEE